MNAGPRRAKYEAMLNDFAGLLMILPPPVYQQDKMDPEKMDPTRFKYLFTNPTSFEAAWNHPEPFQRKKWRAAIIKELTKMNETRVWIKVKKSTMPKNR